MCVRLCDIHSRFRRVTFKKLRSAPPIGNKSPDGMFVSPVVVATHTRTKPKKKHVQTRYSTCHAKHIILNQIQRGFIYRVRCVCVLLPKMLAAGQEHIVRTSKKKKEEHEKNYNVCMTASRSLPQGNWPPVCRLIYSDYEISALALCQTIAPQILH